ncbi:MAG: hypothetical protein Q9M13_01435, partial [Mariprofundales bacterium]|nr:hypothetical protein [Mariprofundales bacterium]
MLIVLLSACGNAPSGVGSGGTSSTTSSSTTTTTTTTTGSTTVTGSVGDGPVSGATLTFTDANGALLNVTDNSAGTTGSSAKSTATASYSVTLPASTVYPVTVTATGGTDLARSQLGLTPTAPIMTLTSVIMDTNSTVVHVSPLTTLAVETAKV